MISSAARIRPISAPTGAYCSAPLPQFGEIDVKHHDDEEEEHRNRADIDHEQDHRQELGAGQQEQTRGIEEGKDQEQHGMHRIAGRNHHEGHWRPP